MRRITGFISAVCFVLWILPMGNFIRASQESTACGGGRAFHMCSMMQGKAGAETSSKISFTNGTSAEKTAKSSAGGGDDLVMALLSLKASGTFVKFQSSEVIFTPLRLISSVEPVPKF